MTPVLGLDKLFTTKLARKVREGWQRISFLGWFFDKLRRTHGMRPFGKFRVTVKMPQKDSSG